MRAGFADTIFAVASGVGRAALTVVRVSGPATAQVLGQMVRSLPPARTASLRALRDDAGILLDRALLLWFPGPSSYTGEDCCELHLHGGQAVLDGVMSSLMRLGARQAERGEFTRRAVTHGRMDLLEAEAVADLIDAETALQRAQALRQMGGALSAVYSGWAARLLRLLAQQEAMIDFPDEDLPVEIEEAMRSAIAELGHEFAVQLDHGARGEKLRAGLVFAIAGAPNAGKSTLINALCQRDVAIVSPRPGTTRDVLEARIEIAGVPVTLLDTAGLRSSDDPDEAEGIRRARARAADADLVLALESPDADIPDDLGELAVPVLAVLTKCDLGRVGDGGGLAISAITGEGMPELMAALEDHVRRLAGADGSVVLTRARHRMALAEAAGHLSQALLVELAELRGEELRLAMLALGRVTGAVSVEEVLDSVFGQFCIGK